MVAPTANIESMPVIRNLADFDQQSGNGLERLIFNHRRRAAAAPYVTATVRYGTSLSGWTNAVHDGTNVIVTVTSDFHGAGIDKVETKIRKTLISGGKGFVQLLVTEN